ncbi:MAG: hypothetical protein AB1724_12840 [Thermodesulfobacteriota bacterium]
MAFACYLAWLGWTYLGPHKPEVSPLRRQAADQIVPQVIRDLHEAQLAAGVTALLHLANDPSDYVTDQLRSGIELSGVVDLRDRTFMEKARALLNLRQPVFADISPAVSRGKALGAQNVIFGRINAFESVSGGARIDCDLLIASVESGQVLLSRKYHNEIASGLLSGAAVQEQIHGIRPARRFLSWMVVVLLLPVFSISFIRGMVRKESNKVNAFTLAVYTAADALIAYLLLGAALTGWFTVILFIIAVGAALAYNYYIMNFALKLET